MVSVICVGFELAFIYHSEIYRFPIGIFLCLIPFTFTLLSIYYCTLSQHSEEQAFVLNYFRWPVYISGILMIIPMIYPGLLYVFLITVISGFRLWVIMFEIGWILFMWHIINFMVMLRRDYIKKIKLKEGSLITQNLLNYQHQHHHHHLS